MDSSEEESDEDFELQHWNNWSEPVKELSLSQNSNETITKYVFNKPGLLPVASTLSDSRFGNWIPPANFLFPKDLKTSATINKNDNDNVESHRIYSAKNDGRISSKWEVNEDWGERAELSDVTKFNEGDLIWGVVNLGCFGRMKLWVNEYKNICVLAEGTLSKIGSTESTLISVVKSEHLRKILCLSTAQWASLCEEVLESKASLNFDAFQDCDMTNKSPLDKMWFFICKRRHFLQDQCMLVKLSGAVKCLKRFEIVPKLVVQDIRNLKGKQIS